MSNQLELSLGDQALLKRPVPRSKVKKKYDISKVAQRRYYMNRVLKENGIHFNSKLREVKVPYKCFQDIPEGLRYYIGQCIKHNYNVQYEIIS